MGGVSKTVQSGGSFMGQIGEFVHAVEFGEKGRAELLERLKAGRQIDVQCFAASLYYSIYGRYSSIQDDDHTARN